MRRDRPRRYRDPRPGRVGAAHVRVERRLRRAVAVPLRRAVVARVGGCRRRPAAAPRPYRRKNAPTFVVAIAEITDEPTTRDGLLTTGYPLLVRALANLCIMVSETPTGMSVRFVTLEQGTYGVGPGLDDAELVQDVFARIEPLVSSQLVIANDLVPDLPEALWQGDEQTAQMLEAGRRLDALDLLPPPLPPQ